MKPCNEVAIFKVNREDTQRAIALSHKIFTEMNADGKVHASNKVLAKTDNPEELCWLITYVDADAAKNTTARWREFASTKEFQELVQGNLYFGHFVDTADVETTSDAAE